MYDQIGSGYSTHRCPDRRIVEQLVRILSLSPPGTIADIGAGTGNYSRPLADLGFEVEAIEPSGAMRRQADPHPAVRWWDGCAEKIPLPDGSVDALICILAVHHFSSLSSATAEMARACAAGPIVWLTFDPREVSRPWLAEYFPSIWEGAFSTFPSLADVRDQVTSTTCRHVEVEPFLVPWDLEDCFMAAGWRRPEMYLDPDVRACMSAFAQADPDVVNEGLRRLKSDLQTGEWNSNYRALLDQDAVDWGYRFLKAS